MLMYWVDREHWGKIRGLGRVSQGLWYRIACVNALIGNDLEIANEEFYGWEVG